MIPKRPRGRPRLDPSGPSIGLTIRIGPRQFDALFERARAERSSVPDLIRKALIDFRTRK